MKRDFPRNQLPAGAVWNLIDWIPGVGAPLRKRGGAEYASGLITDVISTSSSVAAGINAEFTGGTQLLVIDEDGRLAKITSTSLTTDVGAAVATAQNPVLHRNKVVIPAADGTTAPKSYDGTTLGNLAGSPPTAKWACVYKDLTILASSSANPTRVWFSDDGDPTSWDTTNRFLDTSFPITGVFPIRNAILIFSTGAVERLRGSIPPPGSDMSLDLLAEIGCTDVRSVAAYGDQVIYANPGGLYITDGAAVDDLTRLCGMKTWWQDVMNGLAGYRTGSAYSSSWTIAGGIFRNFYFYSLCENGSNVDAGFIDLTKFTWHRLTDWSFRSMFRANSPEELYAGRSNVARLWKTSPIFDFSNKSDPNEEIPNPVVELPFIEGRPGKKRVKNLYLTWDTRDAANDGPELVISYVTAPEATSYTELDDTATATDERNRARFPFNKSVSGIGLKFEQVNAASDTRLWRVEADMYPEEPSRL